MTALLSKIFVSGLELHESYDWQDTAPNMYHSLYPIHYWYVHSRCGVCMGVSGSGYGNICFSFKPFYLCNHIPRPHF